MAYYASGPNGGKPTKKAAERIHAKERAQKRFRLNLTREVRGKMIGKIQSGQTVLVEKRSLRTAVHMMVVSNQLMLVVYDKYRHEIVTLIKPEKKHILLAKRHGLALQN